MPLLERMNLNDAPDWFKLLNVDASQFERSKYAGEQAGKFRIKDLGLLRRVAPKVYQAAAEEVKEGNEFIAQHDKRFGKVKLGRKLGSIPAWDAALRPELLTDPKAQDKYFQDHPEFRAQRPA